MTGSILLLNKRKLIIVAVLEAQDLFLVLTAFAAIRNDAARLLRGLHQMYFEDTT